MYKVYLASDHAGFELKGLLASYIGTLGIEVIDMGPASFDPTDDYPDYILPCARKVAEDSSNFGIVLGKSGQGEAMAANRVPDARAAVYYGGPSELVRLEREHNNANILSLGAKFLSVAEAQEAVRIFLDTPFSGDERHIRRLAKF